MRTGESLLIGTLLERRYRIDAPIARGGMSTVFRGMDTRLDRTVAIKVMDPKFAADPQFVTRFEFEARAVAGLKHPALVAVYDQGHDDEHAFLVMELVEGGTLRELLRERGPMPPHAVRAVAEPVLEALGVAHRAGLVHRDVKPENVLIDAEGDVKIADFGLVRAIAASNTTSSSVILGTAAYLSPEQVDTGNADARSDVYSFGVLIYELLTGTTPFTGDTSFSIAYQRMTNEVPAPSLSIPGVPPEFDALVAKATARNPEDRFPDGAAMAAELRSIATALRLPDYRVPAPRQLGEQRTQLLASPDHAGILADHPTGPQQTRVETRFTGLEPAQPHASPQRWEEPEQPRRRPSRKLLIWIGALVAVALMLGIGGWLLGSSSFVTVASVSGLDKDKAVTTLAQSGLDPVIQEKHSDDRPVGTVLGTDPPSGWKLSKHSKVAVLVSTGKPKVPAISPGTELAAAEQQIRDTDLQPQDGGATYDSSAPEGTVVRLEPKPGTVVPVGSAVKVFTSKGAAPLRMPDLSGASVDEAASTLGGMGIKVSAIVDRSGATASSGRVVATDPPAGSGIGPGSGVKLIVARSIRIPTVIGDTVRSARHRLESLGLRVRVDYLFGNNDNGRVVGQAPGLGDAAEPGTVVVLNAIGF